MKGRLGIVLLLQMYALQGCSLEEELDPLLPQQVKCSYSPLLPVKQTADGWYYVSEEEMENGLLWTKKPQFQAAEDLSGGRSIVHRLKALTRIVCKNTNKIKSLEATTNQLRNENELLSKKVRGLETQVKIMQAQRDVRRAELDLEALKLAFFFPELPKKQST